MNQPDKIDNNGMNALRVAVPAANDDIISISGLLVEMAAVVPSALLIAGLSALIASAFSMTGGEYSSIAAQRDTERAAGAKTILGMRGKFSQTHVPRFMLLQ